MSRTSRTFSSSHGWKLCAEIFFFCFDGPQNTAALDAAFSTRAGEIRRPLPVHNLDRARSRSSTRVVTAAFTPSLLLLRSAPALRSRGAWKKTARHRRRTSRPRWKRCRDHHHPPSNRPLQVGLARARWLLRRAKRCGGEVERQPGRRMRRVAKLGRTRWTWMIEGHVYFAFGTRYCTAGGSQIRDVSVDTSLCIFSL